MFQQTVLNLIDTSSAIKATELVFPLPISFCVRFIAASLFGGQMYFTRSFFVVNSFSNSFSYHIVT